MILTTPTQPGTLSLQHRVVKLLFLLCTYSLYCHSFGMHCEELDDPCRHGVGHCWILYYTMWDIKINEILTQKSHSSTVEALIPSHIMNASAFLTCKFQVLGDFLLFRAVSSVKCVSTNHNTSERRILNSSSWSTRVQQPYTPQTPASPSRTIRRYWVSYQWYYIYRYRWGMGKSALPLLNS